MKRKILLAVDDSRQSENAVRYVAGLRPLVGDMELVLFHVQPQISKYLLDEARTKPEAYRELMRVTKIYQEAAEETVSSHKNRLVALGVPEDAVQARTVPRNLGVARDLLDFGNEGLMDAIVMGRRGFTGVSEFFAGSVSSEVMDHSAVVPVWMVDGAGPSGNIMLAADGSESSLRAVDHLAFMLAGTEEARITIFHATPRLKSFCPIDFEEETTRRVEAIIRESDSECIDRFYAHAREILEAAGIGKDRIDVRVESGLYRIGRMILDAYHDGDYGTLVLGRRGMDRKFYTGSVSRYVINQFSRGALWVIP